MYVLWWLSKTEHPSLNRNSRSTFRLKKRGKNRAFIYEFGGQICERKNGQNGVGRNGWEIYKLHVKSTHKTLIIPKKTIPLIFLVCAWYSYSLLPIRFIRYIRLAYRRSFLSNFCIPQKILLYFFIFVDRLTLCISNDVVHICVNCLSHKVFIHVYVLQWYDCVSQLSYIIMTEFLAKKISEQKTATTETTTVM